MTIKFKKGSEPVIYGVTTVGGGQIKPFHIRKLTSHRCYTVEQSEDVESFHENRQKAIEWLVNKYTTAVAAAKRQQAIFGECLQFWKDKLEEELKDDIFTEYQK